LRIATWNIERLRHKSELPSIITNCEQASADILVLTETDSRLNLKYKSRFSTPPPQQPAPIYYQATETCVAIYTNYELVRQYPTFDEHTAICVELKTEVGNLLVYGTIVGSYGNRHESFMPDLLRQSEDIERMTREHRLCFVGDYNCSFADNYYFTKNGRKTLDDTFSKTNLVSSVFDFFLKIF
jgi:exonuclease III